MKARVLIIVSLLLIAVAAFAQRRLGSGLGGGFRGSSAYDDVQTAREIPSHSSGTPNWTNQAGFQKDAFTFVRIKYERSPYRRAAGWATDMPDSDLNLSFRLQQVTSMKVDPDGRCISLTDPELANFPFIYIVEPGGLYLSQREINSLRKYLLNGGFLWLDDFWGEAEWENCEDVMRKVFPEYRFTELSLDHPIYHCVFDIKAKTQVPAVAIGVESEVTGITWERTDAKEVHHRAIFDDKNRLIVLATHNTDNGDGWEREGENDYYFHNFSEKAAYPLAINVLFYIMTH